ncbi:MAG: iron-sulfur cluster repair protein YtfE [Rhodanobacter sp.]|nr:iron-sulfur cluster repair protein YtfE [Rhodanobacter sp.]
MDLLDQSLRRIACQVAGATAVFRDYQLDFCRNGNHPLREAAASAGVDAQAIVQRLHDLPTLHAVDECDWAQAAPHTLIAHILERFHAVHREQLPELIRLARRVEQVHAEREGCPHGLADRLCEMQQELESHLQKEEMILFPMIERGAGAMAGGPINVMRMEHDQHGQALQELARLTNDITLPHEACTTWRALYLGLRTFREDLLEHIQLENNILFEQAQHGAARV